jgi:hypothetical protein
VGAVFVLYKMFLKMLCIVLIAINTIIWLEIYVIIIYIIILYYMKVDESDESS